MLRRFLTEADEELLATERRLLLGLRDPLAQLDASRADLAVLDRALLQLDELFLLVIVGEFNAGKSAVINALLGERLLPEGVTPTTTRICLIKYGEEQSAPEGSSDIITATFPTEWLRDINLIDTPGTNAIIQQHQRITEDFVPRADLVLFVTSADRPFTESERLFLTRIREWGKKVVAVINKIDILETPTDVDHVVEFVATNLKPLLGGRTAVFPVSARLARRAKETIDADERTRLWAVSRFEPLESYIVQTLDKRERLRLKLANPVGVARRLVERHLEVAAARTAMLRDDIATVKTVEAQLATHDADMHRDFRYRLSEIDNVLYALSERGDRFFDDTIRLTHLFDLLNTDRIRLMFEREVVADTATQIDRLLQELVDWLVEQDYRQWQAVMDYLNKRASHYQDVIVGQVGGPFQLNRKALLDSVERAARDIVSSYDHEAEAKAIAQSVQAAVAQLAIVEAGAIGLGAILVKLLAVAMADVTGVLAAGALAVAGFYLIPYRRRKAKHDLHAKVNDLRERLTRAMTDEFERELARSLARIRDAIRPYTRFVESQQASVVEAETALLEAQRSLQSLAGQIERM